MAFFSFSLLMDSFLYLSTKIEPNKKYYSKDIALSSELNNKNKITLFAKLNNERRINISNVEKTDFIRFLLRDGQLGQSKPHVKPPYILSPKSVAMT